MVTLRGLLHPPCSSFAASSFKVAFEKKDGYRVVLLPFYRKKDNRDGELHIGGAVGVEQGEEVGGRVWGGWQNLRIDVGSRSACCVNWCTRALCKSLCQALETPN